MSNEPDPVLDLKIGDISVGENLNHAIGTGRLIENADGTLELAGDPGDQINWMFVNNGPPLDCGFLISFMFRHAYAESAVPHGCSTCYKVKVVFRTLRELVAGWEIGKRVRCRSKWGTDLNNPYSQNIYAGYFYVSGLDAARVVYKVVRQVIDDDPRLGPDIAMTIKRGCSEYEAIVGPSESYQFSPEMAELEAHLRPRFREHKGTRYDSMVLANWIETAFRIGDDTYLDFTGGKRLRKKTMTYDPL